MKIKNTNNKKVAKFPAENKNIGTLKYYFCKAEHCVSITFSSMTLHDTGIYLSSIHRLLKSLTSYLITHNQ